MRSSLSIGAGTLSEIAVVKQEFSRLMHPYGSKCDHFDVPGAEKEDTKAPDYVLPLRQHECSEISLAQKTIERCKCYDSFSLPYLAVTPLFATVNECSGSAQTDAIRGTSLKCASPSITVMLATSPSFGQEVEKCSTESNDVRHQSWHGVKTALECSYHQRNAHLSRFDPASNCVRPCSEVEYVMKDSSCAWPEESFGAPMLSKIISKRHKNESRQIPNGISGNCEDQWYNKCNQEAYTSCLNEKRNTTTRRSPGRRSGNGGDYAGDGQPNNGGNVGGVGGDYAGDGQPNNGGNVGGVGGGNFGGYGGNVGGYGGTGNPGSQDRVYDDVPVDGGYFQGYAPEPDPFKSVDFGFDESGQIPGFTTRTERFKSNLVKIQVFYDTLSVEKFTETKDGSFTDLLAAMAGLLGLFLGFSVMSVAEGLELLAVTPFKRKVSRPGNAVAPAPI